MLSIMSVKDHVDQQGVLMATRVAHVERQVASTLPAGRLLTAENENNIPSKNAFVKLLLDDFQRIRFVHITNR